jgi:WD40 repeat protein
MSNITKQMLKVLSSHALLLITIFGATFAAGQSSVLQKIRDAARQAAQQKAQQQAGQTPKPGQPRQPQNNAPLASSTGRFAPPAGTKVEQQVLAPLASGARFYVSPHGVHVAAVENSGSRVAVIYDNVAGPKFDEILSGGSEIAFSPDGSRFAYCGRSGSQFVVMVDGKELVRSSDSFQGQFSCNLGFTSNSKHVYYLSNYNLANNNSQFTRVVFDGNPGPNGTAELPVAFSPDGDHYAYVISEVDSANRHHPVLIVDGKPAGYQGGAPQWSGDSKHLFTVLSTSVPGRGNVEDLLLDGKPVMRATSIKPFPGPLGVSVVSIATVTTPANKTTAFLVVGNKKVPGSDVDGIAGAIDQVVFSPDGKHFAAQYHLQNTRWVVTDGKKGLEYSEVDHLGFTADSSKVVYQAGANNKHFIVEGEEESDGFNALFPPVIAPAGGHVGALVNSLDNRDHVLVLDGKTVRGNFGSGTDLAFSPDGAHYAFWKNVGSSLQLVLDGVPQPASNLGQNIAKGFVFSPDSKHLGHFGVAPNASDSMNVGLFLDGKYIPVGPAHGPYSNLSFTADSKHVIWTHQTEGPDFRLFVDGKPVVEGSMAGIPQQLGTGWWDMAPDGSLRFLSEDDASLKRITITPSPDTSVATLTGGGAVSAANHH